jgi:hypothetical protein
MALAAIHPGHVLGMRNFSYPLVTGLTIKAPVRRGLKEAVIDKQGIFPAQRIFGGQRLVAMAIKALGHGRAGRKCQDENGEGPSGNNADLKSTTLHRAASEHVHSCSLAISLNCERFHKTQPKDLFAM